MEFHVKLTYNTFYLIPGLNNPRRLQRNKCRWTVQSTREDFFGSLLNCVCPADYKTACKSESRLFATENPEISFGYYIDHTLLKHSVWNFRDRFARILLFTHLRYKTFTNSTQSIELKQIWICVSVFIVNWIRLSCSFKKNLTFIAPKIPMGLSPACRW